MILYCVFSLRSCCPVACLAFNFALSCRFKDYANVAQRHFLCVTKDIAVCHVKACLATSKKTSKCLALCSCCPSPPLAGHFVLCQPEKIDEILDWFIFTFRCEYSTCIQLRLSAHFECCEWPQAMRTFPCEWFRIQTQNRMFVLYTCVCVCVCVLRIKLAKIFIVNQNEQSTEWALTVGKVGKTAEMPMKYIGILC